MAGLNKATQENSGLNSRIDVLQVIYGIQCVLAIDLPNADPDNDLSLARHLIAEVFEAARDVMTVSDFPDIVHAEVRLREALDACQPSEAVTIGEQLIADGKAGE
ncbi:hypothetical protein [Stenotrophomonas maltophilia]|uniref:Uncharacterized protein n=1 Tax=Stenotrophomonas maltophilia TaxID=40324 RepID=A0AAJ2JC60_STEMA|nr:hypothetical protein [Stenotrophomonas maltophilia]MDT3468956.1 hypothetical protein [Stenotrophomonas maltophilia]